MLPLINNVWYIAEEKASMKKPFLASSLSYLLKVSLLAWWLYSKPAWERLGDDKGQDNQQDLC